MKTLQRFALAALVSLGSLGAYTQTQYLWVVSGTVTNCYPGQVVTIANGGGITPGLPMTVMVDSIDCSFEAIIDVNGPYAGIILSTMCGGMITYAGDSSAYNFLMDTVYTSVLINCGGGVPDCNGMIGGPDVPGAPCDDGDSTTVNDVWSASCVCSGNVPLFCNASFTVQQTAAWTIATTNTSTGTAPFIYQWWMPDGSSSSAFEPGFTFISSGVYGICLTITDAGGCSSWACDTLVIDSAGMIYTGGGATFDCLGMLFGPNVPGTTCDDSDSTTINDTWTASCTCVGTGTGALDCLGVPGGSAQPGTACIDSIGGFIVTGTWDSTCVCIANTLPDCTGIPGGPNVPGSPCDDGNVLTTGDTWNSSCVCVGGTGLPCNADFWVLQAYTIDSLLGTTTPIPYTLWVWNLTSGGSGSYSFSWSFGDGTGSTSAYPTHTYAGSGPYLLCLTIDDGMGCTDTYCDSISIDASGFYVPFGGHNDDRASGFTINVTAPIISGVHENELSQDLATWPNPAGDVLNVAFASNGNGTVEVTLLDAQGRIVRSERLNGTGGRTQMVLSTAGLDAGIYLLRVGDERGSVGQRIVKSN